MSVTKLKKGWLPGALALALVWACGDDLEDITGLDGPGDPINFSREITLGELQDALVGGAGRLEIELIGESLVARRVVLDNPEALNEHEALESRVTEIVTVGDGGALTLVLGELQVSFDPETSFSIGDDEVGFDGFVERVEGRLAEGFEPWVKATRSAPEQPRDATDSRFHAHALKLVTEGDAQGVEINVDADNLTLNADPQDAEPDGWIEVLGLSIELRVSDGITVIETEDVEISDEACFEGVVSSVDVGARTFEFTDGTVVRIVDGETQILETEFDVQLLSLEAVGEALASGHEVVAWGCGEVEHEEPRVVVALELRFALRDDDGGSELVEFEGFVTSVDFENSSFTLKNGTVVVIAEHTELITVGEGELLGSLEEVHTALEAGHEVVAWGAGEIGGVEPLTIVASEMRFVLQPGSDGAEFEGYVEAVDMDGLGSFTLTSGTVIHMTDGTLIMEAEEGEPLMSLQAVLDALEGGGDVIAWGEGEKEGTEPLTISAVKVWFVLAS